MDIVYPMLADKESDELRYSLRSLVNLPHDKVIFVGGCPKFINQSKVTVIPNQQTKTKWKNSTSNVIKACKSPLVSDDFILMNDDFYILKPVAEPVRDLNLARGYTEDVVKKYLSHCQKISNYLDGMQKTLAFLQGLGIEKPLCFELHIPIIFNKDKFLKMFELPGIEKIEVLHKRSVYGNLYYKTPTILPHDVKVLNRTKFEEDLYKDYTFLSTSDLGFKKTTDFLNKRFPNKSVYEI